MHRWLQVVAGIPLCWLLLQTVHELGHILACWVTGGTLRQVVLHPLELSRTELSSNPHPLIVAWSGALFGSLAPVLSWLAARRFFPPVAPHLRFLAGFCLAGNGIYYIVGTLDPGADPGDVMRYGGPPVLNYLFGITALAAGLALWNRLAPELGFGPGAREVAWWVPAGLASALTLAITILVHLP